MNFDTCIILAAGRGTRMKSELPKVLLPINRKPALQYAIDFWKPFVKRFVFVVGYKAYEIVNYLDSQPIDYEVVGQIEQKGIAHALLQVKDRVSGAFVVQLGDCLNIGEFEYPERMTLGYGLWAGNYQKQLALCCSAWTENGDIVRVVEKGRAPYVGIGTYFFDGRVFDYIAKTLPSSYRNEIEITEVLQNMIDAGERLLPVYLKGEFVNLTYPEDIKNAEEILRR